MLLLDIVIDLFGFFRVVLSSCKSFCLFRFLIIFVSLTSLTSLISFISLTSLISLPSLLSLSSLLYLSSLIYLISLISFIYLFSLFKELCLVCAEIMVSSICPCPCPYPCLFGGDFMFSLFEATIYLWTTNAIISLFKGIISLVKDTVSLFKDKISLLSVNGSLLLSFTTVGLLTVILLSLGSMDWIFRKHFIDSTEEFLFFCLRNLCSSVEERV